VVVKNQAPYKERVLYALSSLAPEVDLRINNADIDTLNTALLTRMYFCEVQGEYTTAPLPSYNLIHNRLSRFHAKLSGFRATPISLLETVEMYRGRKRTIYMNALESLDSNPVCRGDSVSVAFVKCEKVNPGKAPRCIQPRDPRYNLELGAYIKPIEHRIYKRIAKIFGDGPTVIKGYNVQEVAKIMTGKWNSFNHPVAVGLDATKFDMHVSPAILRWEHSIYNKIYGAQKLSKLLLWQLFNIGRGHCDNGKLFYKVTGKRFSGDMNTALGNCIIMCAMIYEYSLYCECPVKLMNNGDDCVVFMEREHLVKFQNGLSEWFLEMGFRMVVESPCYDLAKIEFCQMHCIRTVTGPIMVRNMPTSLSKDCLSIVPLNRELAMRKWLGAVGECGLALTAGVPVANAFYHMFVRNGIKDSRVRESVQFQTGIHMLMAGLQARCEIIIPESRYDVWLAWGIEPDLQIALESEFGGRVIEYGDLLYDDHSAYPHREWG